MGTGFSKKKKQAKMLQQQFTQMKSQIENTEAVGIAANGLVQITLSGEHEMKQVKIKPECVDPEDVEGLQDLIKVAYNDAASKLKAQSPEMPSGMPDLSSFGL